MLATRTICLILLAFCAGHVDGAKIMFYNGARIAHSHMLFMGKIADILHDAGHNVTFYQQETFKSVNVVGVRKAKAIVRPAAEDMGEEPHHDVWHPDKGLVANLEMFKVYANALYKACESQLLDKDHIERIRSEKYDMAILEYFDVCGLAITEMAGIKKFITTSALMEQNEMLKALGHPLNLAFVPSMGVEHGSRLTYSQRAQALIGHPIKIMIYRLMFGGIHALIDEKFGRHFDYEGTLARSSYVLINVDEHLTFQMPLSRKIVHIGGLGQDEPPKPLPKDFKSIVDKSKNGVVIISFGTIAQSSIMPPEKKQSILDTVKKFSQYDFIWKYEVQDDVGSNLTNLHKAKWIPQTDLLAHPKVLAFLTHGGLNSVSETAHRGKPFVCVPLFADQNTNCFAGEEKGIGLVVLKDKMAADLLINALDQVLHNPKFKLRAQHLAGMMSAKPFQPRDRIVGYVNHALRFDVHSTLDLPSRHLTFVQYHFIDVIAPLLLSATIILFAWLKFLVFVYRRVCGSRKIKNE
uniref:glucuronosyltransferase n=1 Tax=Bursaphelenchus xylophilus TaxID=6326 RepID=A0A1I7SCX7_BURXY